MKKIAFLAFVAVVVGLSGSAWAEATPSSVLRSLPAEAQKSIERVRESCPSDTPVTSGDEGLMTFTVSGAQAVLVDELSFCGKGGSASTASTAPPDTLTTWQSTSARVAPGGRRSPFMRPSQSSSALSPTATSFGHWY